MAAMRSPRVFGRHPQALGAEDLEEIVADYSNDAIFVTRQASNAARMASTRRSPRSPRRGAAGHLGHQTTIYEDDSLLLEWGAEGGDNRIEDGIDTFVFRDGLIRVQTVRYTLQSAP